MLYIEFELQIEKDAHNKALPPSTAKYRLYAMTVDHATDTALVY